MYYRLGDDVLFRQYQDFGVITDNSEYGYRMLNDNRPIIGEKYISESGAVMLSMVSRTPRDLESIIDDLLKIFEGVDRDTLRADTLEFFDGLERTGYLVSGENWEICQNNKSQVTVSESGEQPDDKVAEGSSDSIHQADFLRSIHFDIASACNERCVHCYIPHKYKTDRIDPELFYKVIREGRDMNIIHVTLSGGEPLLHPDILAFLKKCHELDLSVNVLSNLTLLNDSIIDEMKQNPLLSVQTSIYSMDSKVHDSITKREGSLEQTITGVRKLLDANIPVQISCPVMKQNKDSVRDVIRWGNSLNIGVAIEPVIFASFDGSCSNVANRLDTHEIAEVIETQLKEGYAQSYRLTAREKEAFSPDAPICSVCRYSFCVSVRGEIFPCAGWQANIIGDACKDSIKDIWEKSEKIQELRSIKRSQFPKCVDCKDRGYCTVCMMVNSNENADRSVFRIQDYHCKVAALIHDRVDEYGE